MRRRFRRPKKFKPVEPRFRVNDRIRSETVLVVDDSGNSLGEMDTSKAIAQAQERGLDLVEVSPKAQPPVCRIIDFGKFQYQQAKQQQHAKSKQKKVETKGVRIGLRTDEHDVDFKKRQTEKFLKKGHKVKIEIVLRGREKAHQDLARENLQSFMNLIELPFTTEEDIKKFPGGFNVIISPE